MQGLGIAALVLSIVAIFVPVIGPWLTILVVLMAAFAYGRGLALAIAAIVIDVVNLAFLSPQLWLGAASLTPQSMRQGNLWGVAIVVLFASQLVAFIVVLVLHKTARAKPTAQ